MAIIKAVSSRASIGNAIKYVTKTEKTEARLVTGIGCSPSSATDEMKLTKEIWGKTEGRQYKHIVQSFPPGEKTTEEQAHEIAVKLCESQFKGFETLIATHKDKEHIHSHIIVNSVSHEDGRKFQQSAAELQATKDKSDELCRERGLSTAQKKDEITADKAGKYRALEKGITGGYKSYVLECYQAAARARGAATSRADFAARMKAEGWETTWKDNLRHITFTDGEGNKVRASNLEKTFKEPFGKEDLERGFERNLERENGGSAADGRDKRDGGGADAAIRELEAAIGKSKAAVGADDGARADRNADGQGQQRERDRGAERRAAEKSRGSEERER